MPRRPVGRRSTTIAVAVFSAMVLAAAALWLEVRAANRYTALVEAAAGGVDPVAALVAAGRSHRFLFVTDLPGSNAPDRLVAEAVEVLARRVGVDALVVSVPVDAQPWIDRYLASEPEDAAPLVAHGIAAGGPGAPLLPLYRRIRALNRELGAARSVRIVAADPPDWPPARALAPAQAVRAWAERDEHVLRVFRNRVQARDTRARAVFLLDGLHALRAPFVLRTGGTDAVEVVPVAARLAALWPGQVRTALVDGPRAAGTLPALVALVGSPARQSLRREGIDGNFAVAVSDAFGDAAAWLSVATQPGVSFSLADGDLPLAAAADTYIHVTR